MLCCVNKRPYKINNLELWASETFGIRSYNYPECHMRTSLVLKSSSEYSIVSVIVIRARILM